MSDLSTVRRSTCALSQAPHFAVEKALGKQHAGKAFVSYPSGVSDALARRMSAGHASRCSTFASHPASAASHSIVFHFVGMNSYS